MPPTTDNVANIDSGTKVPNALAEFMKGAHKNQALAHTFAEKTNVFWRSAQTNSEVHVVKMDNDDDVAILIAIHGNISNATIWVKYTEREIFFLD